MNMDGEGWEVKMFIKARLLYSRLVTRLICWDVL